VILQTQTRELAKRRKSKGRKKTLVFTEEKLLNKRKNSFHFFANLLTRIGGDRDAEKSNLLFQ